MAKLKVNRGLIAAAALALIALPMTAGARSFSAESGTIFRAFEQELPNGESATGLPVYEFLSMDAAGLGNEGLSGHLYAWGRHDLGDYYSDKGEGEFLYGYLQYRYEPLNLSARLGRHYLFEGVAADSLDGLSIGGDLTSAFSWSAYYGLPVVLEETNGSGGDALWGGRLANRRQGYYEVGLSYKRVENDGSTQRELIGFDGSLTVFSAAALFGRSVYNNDADEWQEHNYEARLSFGPLSLNPFYRYVDYDAFFDTGADSYRVFSEPVGGRPALWQSGETLTVFGAEALVRPMAFLEAGVKVSAYSYDKRQDDATYWAATLEYLGKGLTGGGVEAGRMEGGNDADSYNLGRVWLYYELLPAFVSCDVVYAKYDEKKLGSLGSDESLTVSLGGGMGFLNNTLKVKLVADYARNPNFENDLRGSLALEYLFSR